MRLSALGILLAVTLFGCGSKGKETSRAVPASLAKPAEKSRKTKKRARLEAASVAPAKATAEPEAEAPKPEAAASCPDDMQAVAGDYCRAVEQKCLEPIGGAGAGPEEQRCARYEDPSRCTSTAREPRRMNFCMDRYEYPNREGEMPITLVSWTDAERICGGLGKRLCTESEFNFACEGEKMLPYTYGYQRDKTKCNIDRPYLTGVHVARRNSLSVTSKHRFLPFELCEANPGCKAEFARLDGREKIGERTECVSPFGIHDMNGNVNEWVSQPWKDPPHRAAIKGGWWGPVRNRCRAITLAHDETYLGYEVGFRCCKDAVADKPK